MIIGVSMVKNEIDVLPYTIRRMRREGVERFVIADNGSRDGTREFIYSCAELAGDWIVPLDDPEPGYFQSDKITALVHEYGQDGDWIIPFDADELWTGANALTLAQALEIADGDVVAAQVWDYLPQPGDKRSVVDPYMRIGWRETMPETYPVVAFRYHPDAVVEMGNHGVVHPGRRTTGLRVRHLQYRSFEHFARKLRNGKAAMEATDLPTSTCYHWRKMGALSDDELRLEWSKLVEGQPLIFDPIA